MPDLLMTASKRPNPSLLLKKASCRAFLVTDPKNILYLTGLSVSAGCVLVSRAKYSLFVDGRYFEAAKKIEERGLSVLPLEELGKTLREIGTVGIESRNVTLERMSFWKRKYKNTKFVQTSGVVEQFRRVKFPDERAHIERASAITRAVLGGMPRLLSTGITEKELAWRIEVECKKRGGEGMAFDTIVGFGEHTAIPHHHPTDRTLRKGDLVQIDMGAKFGGYCSDFSRVYFTEEPTEAQQKALTALEQACAAAMKILKSGVTNRALDLAARKVLKTHGYDKEFSHALGHGVGLDIHEGVTLSSRAELQKIKKNEVVTIEPGLYFPGKWGMRIEETIVVSS